MQAAVDTHVHIYPFYDVVRTLDTLLTNLGHNGPNDLRIGCLAERYDCDLYRELATSPRQSVVDSFAITVEENSLRICSRRGAGEFHLLPGQQIITAENIEILSLACARRVAEGLSASDTVRAIRSLGGVPVVAWAPGKWFFARGKVVRALLDEFSPGDMLLGDTTLRPVGWLTPLIFRTARKRGFRIICGSDPLPFAGEEQTPGSYLTCIPVQSNTGVTPDSEKNEAVSGTEYKPETATAIVQSLLDHHITTRAAGRRGSFPRVLGRLYRNQRAPKPARTNPRD